MPSINDPNIPHSEFEGDPSFGSGAFDSTAEPYAGQYYYKRVYADKLAAVIERYIDSGNMGMSWDALRFQCSPSTLRSMLNQSRAWILWEPHRRHFKEPVVELLLRCRFVKAGTTVRLIENPIGYDMPVLHPTKRKPFDLLANVEITDAPTNNINTKPKTQHVNLEGFAGDLDGDSDRSTGAGGADAGYSQNVEPVYNELSPDRSRSTDSSLKPNQQKPMPFLPDDGDLETLRINLMAAVGHDAPSKSLFTREGIRLTPAEVIEIKSWLPDIGVIGVVNATRIRVAKV